MSSLKLIVSTPIKPTPNGRGFYQIEERSLYVQIGGLFDTSRFYSFIDSPITRFDIDRKGHLLFLEVNLPRQHWKIQGDLKMPAAIEPADIRWLSFRKKIESPKVLTNKDNSILKLIFSEKEVVYNYYLADSVILQVGSSKEAVAMIVTNIVEDTAGREIAEFRRKMIGRDSQLSHSRRRFTTSATLS